MIGTYVGRYAPSPTGALHIGNLFAALCAWGRARRAGGVCRLRMEDLDRPRVVKDSAERIVTDLARFGLTFDGEMLVQSQHLPRYEAALSRLHNRIYACRCSRKELASAPHEGEEGPRYPGTCRDKGIPLDAPNVAWRFRVEPGEVVIDDRLQGRYVQDVDREVGDFVVKRKDGVIAYQLAVVVDDIYQGVTEVVRGRDLLSSAPRQVQLFRALGHAPPAYAHVPLIVDARGERLSKRGGAALPDDALDRIAGALQLPRGLSAQDIASRLEENLLARRALALADA
jgi:glutamyl-Q tRNA(Asp) synthetase